MEEIRKLTAPLTTAPHNSREGGSSFVGGALPYNAMTTKHTKEEWIRDGSFIFALIQDGWRRGEPEMVNKFWLSVDGHRHITEEEKIANAKLIAAAPDLLEACIMFRDFVYESKYPEPPDHIKEAFNNAIKKATE